MYKLVWIVFYLACGQKAAGRAGDRPHAPRRTAAGRHVTARAAWAWRRNCAVVAAPRRRTTSSRSWAAWACFCWPSHSCSHLPCLEQTPLYMLDSISPSTYLYDAVPVLFLSNPDFEWSVQDGSRQDQISKTVLHIKQLPIALDLIIKVSLYR